MSKASLSKVNLVAAQVLCENMRELTAITPVCVAEIGQGQVLPALVVMASRSNIAV